MIMKSLAKYTIFLLLPFVACNNDNTATYRHDAVDSSGISGPGKPLHETEIADSLARAGKTNVVTSTDTTIEGNVHTGSSGENEPERQK
jgi:hypothetical protein